MPQYIEDRLSPNRTNLNTVLQPQQVSPIDLNYYLPENATDFSKLSIRVGEGTNTAGIDANVTDADDVRHFAGSENPANAPWRVTKSGIMNAAGAIISGTITAATILGATIMTALTGRRVIIDSNGISLLDGTSAKYGSFMYGAPSKYGSAIYAQIGNPTRVVPFYIGRANAARADFHFIDRTDLPTGPNEVGDVAVVDQQFCMCVVAGSPGTWHTLHRARYGTIVKT